MAGMLPAEPPVVKSGDHRLSGAGGGNDQVPCEAPNLPLCIQLVQNFLLVGVGSDIEQHVPRELTVVCAFRLQGTEQTFVFFLLVGLKFRRVPIDIKGGGYFRHSAGQIFGTDLHVPFQTAGHGHLRQVGRAHIGSGESAVPVEYVGFGVQTGAVSVVADLDLRVGQLAQRFDGFGIGGSHVGGGDHPQLSAVLGELTQLLDNQSKAAPFDEGYQHVDAVGTGNLFFQFGKHLGLAHRPGEQAAAGQRCLRACQVCCSFSGGQQRVVGP